MTFVVHYALWVYILQVELLLYFISRHEVERREAQGTKPHLTLFNITKPNLI